MSTLKTSTILSRLAFTELSNLKMGDPLTGTIAAENIPQVVSGINRALKDIFTRFLLSTKEILIEQSLDISHYYIRWEYAQSNSESTQPVKYIDDSNCEGFDGRIAKILAVYDSFGRQLFMNKLQEPLSVFTPEYDCLQITANHQSSEFYVIFQALHPEVNYKTTEPVVDTVINIPPSLEDALILLTASKIYEAINGQANITRAAMLHQQYEAKLVEAEIRDTPSLSENMSNGKLEQAGFV